MSRVGDIFKNLQRPTKLQGSQRAVEGSRSKRVVATSARQSNNRNSKIQQARGLKSVGVVAAPSKKNKSNKVGGGNDLFTYYCHQILTSRFSESWWK